ncbi:MAG: hypothetical protein JSW26_24260 [Desulfobacterales bacterium]|nr:MAG: hypothetical protein JSW26_24260 [Desulfobacterales bacterium]
MTANESTQYSPFNEACQYILYENPAAIGVAYKVLNCGCALICGTSAGGDPVGKLHHISGQAVKKGKRPPICLKCRKDNGLDRVVWEGIYWPGAQSEWPDKDLRISIGRKVFGPGYMEPE